MSREISKMHEQHIHGTIDEMIGYLEDGTITKKGEFVLGFVQ
jgi:16S rRNA C1402 (ribose-2'-O) methylase RsmI